MPAPPEQITPANHPIPEPDWRIRAELAEAQLEIAMADAERAREEYRTLVRMHAAVTGRTADEVNCLVASQLKGTA